MSEVKATTIRGVTTDDTSQKTTILLDGTKGLLRAGAYGEDGKIELMPAKITDPDTAVIGAGAKAITSAQSTIYLNAENAEVRFGGGEGVPGQIQSQPVGLNGKLTLKDAWNRGQIILRAGDRDVLIGGEGSEATIHADGVEGSLRVGGGVYWGAPFGGEPHRSPTGEGVDGNIQVRDRNHRQRIELDASEGRISTRSGDEANRRVATLDHIGVSALNANGDATIVMDGGEGVLRLRHLGTQTNEEKKAHHNKDLEWQTRIGLHADKGEVFLQDKFGSTTLSLHSEEGRIILLDSEGNGTIHLHGQTGNITVDGDVYVKDVSAQNVTATSVSAAGEDCAEHFDVSEPDLIEPGTVLVIDDHGRLSESAREYDRRVAGVISGAGEFRPGMLLGPAGGDPSRKPVALIGKVFCKADARDCPIEVGDLLTTSSVPGHAMKAADASKAFGAVIGKALRPLPDGLGLIPILIALQ